MSKRFVIIAPYPKSEAPSQRFRFEQYLSFFEEQGYNVEFYSFLSDKTWKALYKEGSFFAKAFGMLGSFWRRFMLMFKLRSADVVFIHRESSMIGPPMFEWIIAKVLRKKFIYDFDDAIWLPNYSDSNARFQRLKAYGKVKKIMKWAHVVSAGNEHLADFAKQYNSNVTIIPTTIDLENVHTLSSNQAVEKPIIGWTGTHTTMNYLDEIAPVIKELEQTYDFTFRVISNQAPSFDSMGIGLKSLEFVKWNKESEIEDLAKINIGIMPLTDTIWAKGKCGFKGLQYMALEIPSVMSPVGVNTKIVDHKKNGFLCNSPEEWKHTLIELLENESLRTEIGKAGYQTVKKSYSVESNRSNYLNLLNA
ncbi:MAG: glycosyltransferase family 4 protein [Crocinitomicaceae bacterium]|nr:glycosyltransferase family 4 protein [Crocinitomicaceae bacterium]